MEQEQSTLLKHTSGGNNQLKYSWQDQSRSMNIISYKLVFTN